MIHELSSSSSRRKRRKWTSDELSVSRDHIFNATLSSLFLSSRLFYCLLLSLFFCHGKNKFKDIFALPKTHLLAVRSSEERRMDLWLCNCRRKSQRRICVRGRERRINKTCLKFKIIKLRKVQPSTFLWSRGCNWMFWNLGD